MESTEIQSPTRDAVCRRLPANLLELKFVRLGCYVILQLRQLALGLYRKRRFQNKRLVVVKGIFKIPSAKATATRRNISQMLFILWCEPSFHTSSLYDTGFLSHPPTHARTTFLGSGSKNHLIYFIFFPAFDQSQYCETLEMSSLTASA